MNWFDSWGIHFAQPWFLLLLLLIPILSWLRGGRGGAPSVTYSSTLPLRALGRQIESRSGSYLTSLLFLALAFLIVALARPQKGKTLSHIHSSGIDIMICIDFSGSMLEEDYKIGDERASRSDTVKKVTAEFIQGRPADRIGLIAFAGRPYLVSPLTLDHDWLIRNLDRLKVGMIEDGTAIGDAIASAASRLKDRDSKSRIVILLTDGDNNAGKISPATAAEAAKVLGIQLNAISAGTDSVAPYPVKDQFGNVHYVDQNFGFDEKGLKEISAIAQGHYYRAGDTDSMEKVFKDIDKLAKSTVELTTYQQYHDIFPWFIGVGLCLLASELALSQTIWRRLP